MLTLIFANFMLILGNIAVDKEAYHDDLYHRHRSLHSSL